MDMFEVKDIWGQQRFYPPGQHPATYRMRATLKVLEKTWSETYPNLPPNITVHMLAIKSNIAMWEEQHSEAKMLYYERMKAHG